MAHRNDKTKKHNRAVIDLTTDEEKDVYRNLLSELALHGLSFRDVMIPLIREALARLQRRTLLPNKPLTISKKKGVQPKP